MDGKCLLNESNREWLRTIRLKLRHRHKSTRKTTLCCKTKEKETSGDLLGCQSRYSSGTEDNKKKTQPVISIVICQLTVYSEITVDTRISFSGVRDFFLRHTIVCLELLAAINTVVIVLGTV